MRYREFCAALAADGLPDVSSLTYPELRVQSVLSRAAAADVAVRDQDRTLARIRSREVAAALVAHPERMAAQAAATERDTAVYAAAGVAAFFHSSTKE